MLPKLKRVFGLIIIGFFLCLPFLARATTLDVSFYPPSPKQGEAVMIQVEGTTLGETAKITLDGKSLWFFNYDGKPTALYPIDLSSEPGVRTIKIILENGENIEKQLTIEEREKIEAPLGIPEKLGGNTPQAATSLVTNLSKENAIINGVYSAIRKYWRNNFRYPLKYPTITDSYGYLRKTGYYSIPHKGSDFRAEEGTRVYAINDGVVRMARTFTIYGKAVAIDHGLGLVSYYLHLSRIDVKEGERVTKGKVLGLSGMTGYAESPHLHLSIKLNGISIDPDQFLKLFSN